MLLEFLNSGCLVAPTAVYAGSAMVVFASPAKTRKPPDPGGFLLLGFRLDGGRNDGRLPVGTVHHGPLRPVADYRPVMLVIAELPTAVAEIWFPVVCSVLPAIPPLLAFMPKVTLVVVAVTLPVLTW